MVFTSDEVNKRKVSSGRKLRLGEGGGYSGLRLSDSFSCFLFVLVVDPFSCFLLYSSLLVLSCVLVFDLGFTEYFTVGIG